MPTHSLARRLARYALSLDAATIPDAVLACTKLRILDSLACALGAMDMKPVIAAMALARMTPAPSSSVLGTRLQTTPELAAFCNGIMVRYLDYNDGYMSREPGHPSDNIFACLALAEAENRSGLDLIAAIVIAYEIQMRLQDAANLNGRGWDHVNFVTIATAAAASRLLGSDESQTEHAINLALNGHIAMRQVRSGHLSDWKGCSAANAARNAVFAARLARLGMTGPAPIFEGKMGLFAQVTGPFDLDTAAFGHTANQDFMILKSLTKTFPTNGELHTAVWAAIELRSEFGDIEDIASIEIGTSAFNLRVLADAEKWHPRTRETADHSLPYSVARALIDGEITIESYSPDTLLDPIAGALMDRTRVVEAPELTALFPQHLANRVELTLTSGRRVPREVRSGPGSLETPMQQADFDRKFEKMAASRLTPMARQAAREFVASLENQTSYSALFAALARTD